MTMYEFDIILKYSHYAHQEEWEQCRFNSYVTVQLNNKKKLKPQDILSFTWDNSQKTMKVTQSDIERLRKLAKKQEEILNNNNNGK